MRLTKRGRLSGGIPGKLIGRPRGDAKIDSLSRLINAVAAFIPSHFSDITEINDR